MVDILYEDNHLLVVNKPFGMPSQGDQTRDLNVYDWAKEYIRVAYQKPGQVYLGLVHRLDRPAGGVLVLAKTSKAASRLSKQFQAKEVKKIYYALVEQAPLPSHGELKHFLKKLPGKNIMRAYPKPVAEAKEASLGYRTLEKSGGQALLEVKLHTGRRHQIRVQLASLGATIKGDVKYGKTDFNPDKSICLLARRLTFTHPTQKKDLTVEIPIPDGPIWRPFNRLDRSRTGVTQARVSWGA
ncbi:MAG: RluA family pseudouridine synthase [Bacteroidota bacterium]